MHHFELVLKLLDFVRDYDTLLLSRLPKMVEGKIQVIYGILNIFNRTPFDFFDDILIFQPNFLKPLRFYSYNDITSKGHVRVESRHYRIMVRSLSRKVVIYEIMKPVHSFSPWIYSVWLLPSESLSNCYSKYSCPLYTLDEINHSSQMCHYSISKIKISGITPYFLIIISNKIQISKNQPTIITISLNHVVNQVTR